MFDCCEQCWHVEQICEQQIHWWKDFDKTMFWSNFNFMKIKGWRLRNSMVFSHANWLHAFWRKKQIDDNQTCNRHSEWVQLSLKIFKCQARHTGTRDQPYKCSSQIILGLIEISLNHVTIPPKNVLLDVYFWFTESRDAANIIHWKKRHFNHRYVLCFIKHYNNNQYRLVVVASIFYAM